MAWSTSPSTTSATRRARRATTRTWRAPWMARSRSGRTSACPTRSRTPRSTPPSWAASSATTSGSRPRRWACTRCGPTCAPVSGRWRSSCARCRRSGADPIAGRQRAAGRLSAGEGSLSGFAIGTSVPETGRSMPTTKKALREPLALTAPVDPARFVEVTGERIALLGHEDGPFECWLWPLKVLSGLRFQLCRDGVPIEMREREVTVLPGELCFVWKQDGIQLRTEIVACRERPGMAFGFTLDSKELLEIEVSFHCDFRPMWPAGLGGQLARIDTVTSALALSEELGRFAALIGAMESRVELEPADHALPSSPVRIVIPMPPGGSSSVLAIAGAEVEPAPLGEGARLAKEQAAPGFPRRERAIEARRDLWFRLVSDFSAERELVRAHWRKHREKVLAVETPYPALDQAFQWAQVAIERAWVRVEGLGRGLVAGLGPSGSGERPGYGWFFDGDALAASRALCTSGDFDSVRDVLRFAAAHQREDGKLMHELTLSAGLC